MSKSKKWNGAFISGLVFPEEMRGWGDHWEAVRTERRDRENKRIRTEAAADAERQKKESQDDEILRRESQI